MHSKLSRIAGAAPRAALLAALLAAPAQAANDAPAAGAPVNAPADIALQCVKSYMVAGKAYFLVREEGNRLVFEKGMTNPYSLQEIFTTPTTIAYERVHVEVQRAGDTTRIATYYATVAPATSRFDTEAVAIEAGNQDFHRSEKRAARIAAWINSRRGPNDCY